jgi:hypothetical protein
MKCWILLVNRERGRLIKRCVYGAESGKVQDILHREKMKFTIAENVKPITLDISTGTAKNRTVPLFVVNEMSKAATGIELIEKINPKIGIVLDILTRESFWSAMLKKLKVRALDMIIFMGAGYGLLRFIEYIVRIIVLHQG